MKRGTSDGLCRVQAPTLIDNHMERYASQVCKTIRVGFYSSFAYRSEDNDLLPF